MPLIVEDGSSVIGADCYESLTDSRIRADLLGLSLPIDDMQAEIAIRKGARYIDLFEFQFSGGRTSTDQGLSFPRIDCYFKMGETYEKISQTAIPDRVKWAQLFAAVEFGNGIDVMPVNDGLSIQSKEVSGAVKVSYFETGKTGSSKKITKAVNELAPFMNINSGLTVRAVRV